MTQASQPLEPPQTPRSAEILSEYALTPIQEAMLFHHLSAPGSGANVEQVLCRTRGSFQREPLQAAFNWVIKQHDVLRTRFCWQGKPQPSQQVLARAHLSASQLDLSDLPEEAREQRLQSLLSEDRATDFDFAQPPLMRLKLIRLGPGEEAFLWTFHHILLDRDALSIVLGDVLRAYHALREGGRPPAGARPSFRAFVQSAPSLDKQARAYYQALLDKFETHTPLDVGFAAREGVDLGRRWVEARLSAAETEAFRQALKHHGVAPSTLFNAAWTLLLRSYSGRKDVVFGVARDGRAQDPQLAKGCVGLLINSLPQRVREDSPEPAAAFIQALERDWQAQTPFERISPRDVQLCSQIPLGSPLFESLTSCEQRTLDAEIKQLGDAYRDYQIAYFWQTTFPLTLVSNLDSEIHLRLAFDPARYDAATAERMLGHFARLLGSLCRCEDETPVSSLRVLSDEERRRILEEWNQTDGSFPDHLRMHELFEARAAAQPDRVAAVCAGEVLRYGELDARANRLAHLLQAQGVGPDSRVGICLPRSLDIVVSMLAVLKAGAAYVPLDPAYPQDRLKHMLSDTGASVVLTCGALLSSLPEGASKLLCLDQQAAALAAQPETRPSCASTPDDVAYIIYTSGSTGTPKGVVVRHKPAVNLIDWVNTTFQVGPSDRLLFVTSICFDLSVYDVFGVLGAGGSLHVATSEELREPRTLVRLLEGGTITFWDSAPAALTQLVPFLPQEPQRKSKLRLALLSGDWIPVPLPNQLRQAFPKAEIISLGGATEATVWSNYYRIREVPARWPSIPYGRPIRNARYYILDDRLEPVPVGVAAQLHIGGTCLADGYHNRPELNAEKFIDDPFSPPGRGKLYRTGDLARFMPDGNIEFLGRIDQQVKVRGFRIELGEIEALLSAQPGVATSLVDAPRLSGAERTLVAYVVGRGCHPDVGALRQACVQKLPEYMVPAHFVVLDALPTTQNGKVDRRALPAPTSQASAAFVAPRSELETTVAEIVARGLGVDRVGVHDNFFELGGHSLLAVRVISDLSRVFDYEVSLAAFLATPTVEALSQLLEERPSGSSRVSDRIEPAPDAPPVVSLEQSRLAFVQGLYPQSATYNISTAFRLEGEVDVALLERALQAIVQRHEPLRTSFHVSPEGYTARIHAAAPPRLVREDLRAVPEPQRQAALDEIMRRTNGVAFDLAQAPLVRTVLATLNDTTHVLLVVVHHVVFDGPSTAILVRELIAYYDAFAQNQPDPLEPLPIRFNDAARWQLRRLEEQDYSRDLNYWRKRLAGPLPVLQLPHDKPRPRVFSYRGSVMSWRLPPEESAALRRLAQGQRSSVFTLLLAAFSTLLHRYSGQSDVLVAIPVASREQPETRDLIGLLLNTLVIRSQFEPNMTFEAALAHVRTRFLEALDHRELPFERLVADLNPPRDTSITPVFQAFFSYEETSGRVNRSQHFSLSSMVVDQMFAGTDLSLFAEESAEEGIHGYFEFSTDIFERESVAQIAEGFLALLRHIASAPRTQVDLLQVMSEEERSRQITRWNNTHASFDLDRSVVELFEERARAHPHKPAVHSDGASLHYGELLSEVQRLSKVLSAKGAGAGQGVAVFLDRGPRLVASLLAIMRTGAHYIPLDPSHPEERNQRILKVATPRVIVAEQTTLPTLPECPGAVVVDLDQLSSHTDGEDPGVRAQPHGVAYIIFTSGSTGDPKGVEIPHRALTNFLLSMAVRPGMGPEDTILALTTISFDIAGLELYLPLIVGGAVDIAGRSVALDPRALAGRLRQRPATLFQATPATFRMLIEDHWKGQPGLKVLCGGEAFPPDLAQALLSRVGSVWNMYGPTETTIWSSVDQIKADDPVISIGHPIHNTQMYVLNDALQPVPRGCAGMLYIGGDGVACGYHRRVDLTQAAFMPDPFSDQPEARIYRTGDLARRLPDGRLECLGRNDFQVKIRGYRIELGEIEAALLSHPEVMQAVVHVKPTAAGEKRLVGYVVLRDHHTEPPADLAEHIREKLPNYMVPSALMALSAFPLTPNGKVDRKALPEPDAHLQSPSAKLHPRDDIELKVADIFGKYLGVSSFSIEDNFFDLGGHSLLAVRLTRELNATFNVELAVGALFENPSVAGMAEVVKKGGGDLGRAVLSLHKGEGNAPMFFILGIQLYQSLARNIGDGQPSYGIYLPAEEGLFDASKTTQEMTIPCLASMYVEAIREHTPTGPYSIGGVSFGGLLAFEVARQLKAAGEEVALLVLLDAVLPRGLTRNPISWLSRQWSSLRRDGMREALERLRRRLERQDEPASEADLRDEQLWEAFSGPAAQEYFAMRPSYEGPTLLVRASDRSDLPGFDIAPDLGWGSSLLGPLKIVEAQGKHLEILQDPETANLLRAELQAQNNRLRRRPLKETPELPQASGAQRA